MSRPSDHIDSQPAPTGDGITQPKLGFVGTLRWFWRQLTSMRTALFLLLLLAIAAVPGSLVPQRSSDPNGVTQYFTDNPDLAPMLDKIQAFDVYSSAWFSSIYLLLFISLIGCVIPRTKHHLQALRAKPPKTPARLARLAGFTTRTAPAGTDAAAAVASARTLLKQGRYRVALFDSPREFSVSAERGYMRETGNLVFHSALVGLLVVVGFGSGFGFSGQRVLVEGQTFVNTLLAYDSFNPGRFFNDTGLDPYKLTLDDFQVSYETQNLDAFGQPLDFSALVSVTPRGGETTPGKVRVNDPLRTGGTSIYLLGNGYAPTITVRDPQGTVVFTDSVPFLPQDANLTSLGVVKIPDGLAEQVGLLGFFYPTQAEATTGSYFSSFPDLTYPVLTLNVYAGDLGLDEGVPTSVYNLNTDNMEPLATRTSDIKPLELKPGETQELPGGLGSVTFENATPDAEDGDYSGSVLRFASFDIHHDPTQGLGAAVRRTGARRAAHLAVRASSSPLVKAIEQADGSVRLEYAGLARGEDPALESAVTALADRHAALLERGPAGRAKPAPKSADPA